MIRLVFGWGRKSTCARRRDPGPRGAFWDQGEKLLLNLQQQSSHVTLLYMEKKQNYAWFETIRALLFQKTPFIWVGERRSFVLS